jgi:hypothetical protein
MSCYIVQETDGTSRVTLEDATGFLLLENCSPVPPQPGVGGPATRGRRRRLEVIGEEEMLAAVLAEV